MNTVTLKDPHMTSMTAATETFNLSAAQLAICNHAIAALMAGTALTTIGGPAGTGKTECIKYIKANCKKRIAVIAYTGKATSVLRARGVDAETMHHLIYVLDKEEDIATWALKSRSELACDAIIVDEASMIGKEYLDDLMSFNIPILAVGDNHQLPPVSKDDINLVDNPDHLLTDIFRQAEGSGILDFVTRLREDQYYVSNLKEMRTADVSVIPKSEARFVEADVVICGFNSTRSALNAGLRKRKGFTGDLVVGEKIICLSNDASMGLYNGVMGVVVDIKRRQAQKVYPRSKDTLRIEIIVADVLWDGESTPRQTRLSTYCLGLKAPDWTIGQAHRGVAAVIDYAYAITCHRSQGSQWDSVVVMNEVFPKFWEQSRWAYTAGSRAIKQLTFGVEGI